MTFKFSPRFQPLFKFPTPSPLCTNQTIQGVSVVKSIVNGVFQESLRVRLSLDDFKPELQVRPDMVFMQQQTSYRAS